MKKGYVKGILPGYMTLEATYIFVTVLSVMLLVVSVGIYKYQHCVYELDSYYELERSICLGDSTEEYIELQAGKWGVNRKVPMSIQLGIFGERQNVIQIECQIRMPNPILALRLSKRLQRIKEDENREIKSTISEDNC